MGGIYPQANWLQGLAATTNHCGGAASCAGLTPQRRTCVGGSLVSIEPTIECVVCGGGWVVLLCGLKLCTWCTGSVASQAVQAKVSHLCSICSHLA